MNINKNIKMSLVRKGGNNEEKVWNTSLKKIMEKIAQNASNRNIIAYRNGINNGIIGNNAAIKNMHRLYGSVRLAKDDSNNLTANAHTGALLLTAGPVADISSLQQLKNATTMLPSTMAAFTGISGKEIEIIVSVSLPDNNALDDEAGRLRFYTKAYQTACELYSTLLHTDVGAAGINDGSNPMMAWCYMSGDSMPVIAEETAPLKIIIDSTYSEPEKTNWMTDENNDINKLVAFLNQRHKFRFNRVRRTTEYLDKSRAYMGWRPTDLRFINGMAIDACSAGIKARPKDIVNYLNSSKIIISDPTEEFVFNSQVKWDGHDHIGDMAERIKTSLPQWKEWFRLWFLGLVAQWMGYNARFGNSIVPLLISPQGYRKSTFCRQLLPPQLRWGYIDNLKFDNQRQVMMAMADSLLINLDEFNSISKKTQEGFLKNTIQLATIAIKRPYARHIEQERRRASFIATSNMTDVLSDPSGSRRFFAVEVTEPIDTSTEVNYEQLYAQAAEAVKNGERRWFDQKDIAAVMEHNRKYAQLSAAAIFFNEYFEPATADSTQVLKLTSTEIYDYIRKRAGASAVSESVQSFGRYLSNMPDINKRHSRKGTVYLVIERK